MKEDSDPCWDTHKKVGTKMKNGKVVNNCVPKNESAQDRLDRMAKKHGLGKPNKAADDYMAKMRKKYGAKDDADLKRKMGMKEGKYPTSRKPKVIPAPKSDMAKRLARGQRDDPMNKIGVKKETDLKKAKDKVIGELSTKTLGSYISKASDARGHKKLSTAKQDKRYSGVARASRKMDKKLSGESVDSNPLIAQLREAQYKKGAMMIEFRGGETQLPLKTIDKLLDTYDNAEDQKRVVTLITHELRKRVL